MAEASEPSGREQASTLKVLFSRNFGVFWVGNLISNSGTFLQSVAQAYFIWQLTHSNLMVGLGNFAFFIAVFVLGITGGALADRFDRRRLLMLTQVISFFATAILALLAATGHANVAIILFFALLLGVQAAFAIPAMQTLVPGLVRREELSEAVALNSLTFNLGRVVGPALGATILSALGIAWAFGLNSLSFLALIAALMIVRVSVTGRQVRTGKGFELVKEGFVYTWRHKRIRTFLITIAAISLTSDPVNTLSPAFSIRLFHRGAAGIGIISAAFGIGAVAATILLPFLTRAIAKHRLSSLGLIVFAFGMVSFGLSQSFITALIFLLIAGMGFLIAQTLFTSFVQWEVAEEYRGRVMALWSIAFLGSRPFASLFNGAVAEFIGLREAVLIAAIPVLIGIIFTWSVRET